MPFLLSAGRLPWLLGRLGGRRSFLADAPPQRLHQVDDVARGGPLLRCDRLAAALAVDEIDQRGFVVVLEFLRFEPPGLLVDDVLGEVEHVL